MTNNNFHNILNIDTFWYNGFVSFRDLIYAPIFSSHLFSQINHIDSFLFLIKTKPTKILFQITMAMVKSMKTASAVHLVVQNYQTYVCITPHLSILHLVNGNEEYVKETTNRPKS